MTDLERIEQLEEMCEKMYHTMELLETYIPKLMDILIRYWQASSQHRQSHREDFIIVRDFALEMEKQLQVHFTLHHTLDKNVPSKDFY